MWQFDNIVKDNRGKTYVWGKGTKNKGLEHEGEREGVQKGIEGDGKWNEFVSSLQVRVLFTSKIKRKDQRG